MFTYQWLAFSCEMNCLQNLWQLSVEVSGAKTEAIFDDVFSKMVAAAQPIPGFRRVKGGEIREITTSDFS